MTHTAIEVVTTTSIHRQSHYNVFHSESKQGTAKSRTMYSWCMLAAVWLRNHNIWPCCFGDKSLLVAKFSVHRYQHLLLLNQKLLCVRVQLTSWLTSAVLCVFRSSPSSMPR